MGRGEDNWKIWNQRRNTKDRVEGISKHIVGCMALDGSHIRCVGTGKYYFSVNPIEEINCCYKLDNLAKSIFCNTLQEKEVDNIIRMARFPNWLMLHGFWVQKVNLQITAYFVMFGNRLLLLNYLLLHTYAYWIYFHWIFANGGAEEESFYIEQDDNCAPMYQ